MEHYAALEEWDVWELREYTDSKLAQVEKRCPKCCVQFCGSTIGHFIRDTQEQNVPFNSFQYLLSAILSVAFIPTTLIFEIFFFKLGGGDSSSLASV